MIDVGLNQTNNITRSSLSDFEIMVNAVNEIKKIDLENLRRVVDVPPEVLYQLTFIENSVDRIRLLEGELKEKEINVLMSQINAIYKSIDVVIKKQKEFMSNHEKLIDYVFYKNKRIEDSISNIDLSGMSTLEQIKFRDYISNYNVLVSNINYLDYFVLETLASKLDMLGNKIDMANNFINIKYDESLGNGVSK